MTYGAWMGLGLSVYLLLVGIAYAFARDWSHCGYYVSAAVLNLFVVMMK